jgi:hypothetical protein
VRAACGASVSGRSAPNSCFFGSGTSSCREIDTAGAEPLGAPDIILSGLTGVSLGRSGGPTVTASGRVGPCPGLGGGTAPTSGREPGLGIGGSGGGIAGMLDGTEIGGGASPGTVLGGFLSCPDIVGIGGTTLRSGGGGIAGSASSSISTESGSPGFLVGRFAGPTSGVGPATCVSGRTNSIVARSMSDSRGAAPSATMGAAGAARFAVPVLIDRIPDSSPECRSARRSTIVLTCAPMSLRVPGTGATRSAASRASASARASGKRSNGERARQRWITRTIGRGSDGSDGGCVATAFAMSAAVSPANAFSPVTSS